MRFKSQTSKQEDSSPASMTKNSGPWDSSSIVRLSIASISAPDGGSTRPAHKRSKSNSTHCQSEAQNEETSQNSDYHITLGICWDDACSDHRRCKDAKDGTGPDEEGKNRATAYHDGPWPNDDLGVDMACEVFNEFHINC
jgi:hypothetical protein